MAWIESHENVGDHSKTLQLAAQLNCTIPAAVGYLHLLWHYTLKVAWQDGDLTKFPPNIIARACWFDGDPSVFVNALNSSGYLDEMKVHGWKEYAKYIIYQRKYNKNRHSRFTHVTTSRKSCNYIQKSNATLTIPNHTITIPNQSIKDIKKFQKPTVQEISDYAKEIGFTLEPQTFFDFYESKGWVVGKSPMKDWKAAVRTWKRNQGGNYVARTTPVKNVGYATAIDGKYPD